MLKAPLNAGDNEKSTSVNNSSISQLIKTSKLDDKLVQLIHEFLNHYEFPKAAESFTFEAAKMGFNVFNDSISKECCEKIFQDFRCGNWKIFFNSWDNLVPKDLKESKEYKILTLKLRVHFAVLPVRIAKLNQTLTERVDKTYVDRIRSLHLSKKDVNDNHLETIFKEGMNQLKDYIKESPAQELEGESQLVPYFALPHVVDPLTDPTVSKIFELSWVDELISNLYSFFKQNLQKQMISSQKLSIEALMVSKVEPMPKVEKDIDKPWVEEDDRMSSSDSSDPVEVPFKTNKRLGSSSGGTALAKHEETDRLPPIIPNDRRLPIFLEDELLRNSSSSRSIISNSRSTQTRITGISRSNKGSSSNNNNKPTDNVKNNESSENQKSLNDRNRESSASHLFNLRKNYEKLKARFYKLHTDYHRMIQVAGEMTTFLENSVRGEKIDLQNMLDTCIQIHPEFFNSSIANNYKAISSLKMDDDEVDLTKDNLLKRSDLEVNVLSTKVLDYRKIKLHLVRGNVRTKLLLLQALRWKLTLSQPGERDEAINEYVRNDILGLRGKIAADNGITVLPYILLPMNIANTRRLQQSAARFVNAMASLRCGRDYFSIGHTLLDTAVKCLNNDGDFLMDSITCDMLLAMLQKLSLRRQQRLYMIDTGLVEWLVYHLNVESNRMGSYRLEYAMALLMNLSLHKEARIRASAIAPVVITMLAKLLNTSRISVLQNVIATLNNLFKNHIINHKAKKMGLESVLEYHLKQSMGEIRKQLDYILKVHRREFSNNLTESDDTGDEDDEEFDNMEEELEENDPVSADIGELYGETLLAMCYTVAPYKKTQQLDLLTDSSYSSKRICQTSSSEHKYIKKFASQETLIEKTSPPRLSSLNVELSRNKIYLKTKGNEEHSLIDKRLFMSRSLNNCQNNYPAQFHSHERRSLLSYQDLLNDGFENNLNLSIPSLNTIENEDFLSQTSSNTTIISELKISLQDSQSQTSELYSCEDEYSFSEMANQFRNNNAIKEIKSIGNSTVHASSQFHSLQKSSLTADDKSSIASLFESQKVTDARRKKSAQKKSNEPFTAKPKILRTPPQTGHAKFRK